MAKKIPPAPDESLLPRFVPRRVGHRTLFLPKMLMELPRNILTPIVPVDDAWQKAKHWAELADKNKLTTKKEKSLDAEFLNDIFGSALGYRLSTNHPDAYELEQQYHIAEVGTADGVLGAFVKDAAPKLHAIIEMKGPECNLDRDRSNGRTAVQQLFDYLNGDPDCPWGIVSNIHEIRLYHRQQGSRVYEEFQLLELKHRERFVEFFQIMGPGGLTPTPKKPKPIAVELLEGSQKRRLEVGDELYKYYDENRSLLIEYLEQHRQKTRLAAIGIAQKLIDRIIFMAYCQWRGLLPENLIESTYLSVPPFSRVTNPRWRNFVDTFHAIDKGDPNSKAFDKGYNGGLFQEDKEVDELDLPDIPVTNFFKRIGDYNFRDEVNVDVLGHLFERSVSDLERLRSGGPLLTPNLNGKGNGNGTNGHAPLMPKSAERKRHGIYYTPPAFTRFIVEKTIGFLVEEKQQVLQKKLNLSREDLESGKPSAKQADYYRQLIEDYKTIKVCDSACGSGAFMIQAFDLFHDVYLEACEELAHHDASVDVRELIGSCIDAILIDNLFGVDLSPQAVEITQLALWIRSARPHRTLANLSKNIICGNSLVDDPGVAGDRALKWSERFPTVFDRKEKGFDAIIGNPPWERLKLQEREFFSRVRPDIASAVSAAERRRLISELKANDAELFARYTAAQEQADKTLKHVRDSERYPLTGKGDVNTYALFAELAHTLVAPRGRVGILVPSGIGTDHSNKEYFSALIDEERLHGFYDFENRLLVFPDIDGRMKFAVLLFGGKNRKEKHPEFFFFSHAVEEVTEKKLARPKRIELSAKDIALLNPNTKTCPIFRYKRDAELTKAIYQRIPILVDHNRKQGGNPWGIRFFTMFHQTNDAELFLDPKQLKAAGARLEENRWVAKKQTWLPLYEAKMIQAYDHRAASVVVDKSNWFRQGQKEETSLVQHQNPEFLAIPRWWADSEVVANALKHKVHTLLAFKNVTSPTNQRTMIAAMIPYCGVINSAPLILFDNKIKDRMQCCLLANLNTFVLDYISRQKVGNVNLNFFIIEQLPILHPPAYAKKYPWTGKQTLEQWISERVLKLSCTANDMVALAKAADFKPSVHPWDPKERAELLAELDAAYFLLYGIKREDVEYILSTFQDIDKPESELHRLPSIKDLVLTAFDGMT